MLKKIVDRKGRPVDTSFIYTGIIPKGISKEEFRKQNVKFPKGGFYLSTETFFTNTPPDTEGYVTFKPTAAKQFNVAYHGMQFMNKGDKTIWMYFIEMAKLKNFNYIMGGRIDYTLVKHMLKMKGYDVLLYSYAYNCKEETMQVDFYYNSERNVIIKIETNTLTRGLVKLYSPTGILPAKLIFSKNSFLPKGWIGEKVNLRKLVKPSLIRCNKNQLDWLEHEFVEVVRDL